MDDKFIFDLLSEIREDQKKQGEGMAKQAVLMEILQSDVKEIQIDLRQNKDDIKHHILRTDMLQEIYEDSIKRIDGQTARLDALEQPGKSWAWVKKHIISIGSILTAASAIIAILASLRNWW